MGFPVVQGVLEQLVGWDALRSFAPALAFLGALNVLALYLLFRAVMRMRRGAGAVAAALGGANALVIWIAYFNFGSHVLSLPLVLTSLLLWMLMLRSFSWRTLLLAGMGVAAVPMVFFPAVTILVPIAAGLSLHEFLRARRRGRLLLMGVSGAAVALVVGFGTILDYVRGIGQHFSPERTTAIGLPLPSFPRWDQVFGLAPYLPSNPLEQAPGAPAFAAVGILAFFGVVGLWLSRRRWVWLAVLLPAVFLVAWWYGWLGWLVGVLQDRWGFLPAALLQRLAPYPYGYLKGMTYLVPLLLGLPLEGWAVLWGVIGVRRRGWPGSAALIAMLLLPAVAFLHADRQMITQYWEQPAIFREDLLRVEEGASLVPDGAGVYVTGYTWAAGPADGLFAYFLRDHPIYGRFTTAYFSGDYPVSGDAPPYALINRQQDPRLYGFLPEERIWAGGGMVLYGHTQPPLSFLDLWEYGSDAPAPCAASPEARPSRSRLSNWALYTPVSAHEPLVLYADAEKLSRADDLPGRAGRRSLLLTLAALEPVRVSLRWDDGAQDHVDLPAGLSFYRATPREMPARLKILPGPGATVWVLWAALYVDGPAGVSPTEGEVLLYPQVEAGRTDIAVNLAVHDQAPSDLSLVVDISRDSFSAGFRYGRWGEVRLPARGTVRLWVEPGSGVGQAWVNGEEVPLPVRLAEEWPAVPDGSYFVTLMFYAEQGLVSVAPAATVEVKGGEVQEIEVLPQSLFPLWPE